MAGNANDQAGGFLPPDGLPSPAPSSASQQGPSGLPHPRGKSLRPGSNKEDTVRRYVEERLLNVSRRYVKKFGGSDVEEDVIGYKSFGEVCRDLDAIVNVLWLSGTRKCNSEVPSGNLMVSTLMLLVAGLQVPFLLKLGSDFTQYVRSFPPSPKASFDLLGKLDHCFSSLLAGRDVTSHESLPGFDNGLRAGMTTTDMVRCRSLVEQTRFLMVEVLSGVPDDEDEEDEEEEDEEAGYTTNTDSEHPAASATSTSAAWDIDDDRLHLDAARIYERTIVQLSERLGDPLGTVNITED